MTNEEKAREIGEFFDTPYLAALEMAEWKEEQFKEYLKNKIRIVTEKSGGGPLTWLKKRYIIGTLKVILADRFNERNQD